MQRLVNGWRPENQGLTEIFFPSANIVDGLVFAFGDGNYLRCYKVYSNIVLFLVVNAKLLWAHYTVG